MTGTPSQGSQAQLAIAATTIDNTAPGFEFVRFGLKRTDTHIEGNGIRGTRSRHSSRVKVGQTVVSGPVVMNPSPTEIDLLLPWILGGTTSGGVTAVAETLPTRVVGIKRVRKMATFSGVRVGRAVLEGSQGQPVSLTLDLEGTSETEAAVGNWPTITFPSDNMFVFAELAMTIDGAVRHFSQFSLTIDNVLQADRFLNSLTRDKIEAQDRIVTLDLALPYDDENEDLYDIPVAGVAASLVLSDGTTTYTIDFANVKAAAVGPEIGGKSEILLPTQFRSYFDGTDREILVTKS